MERKYSTKKKENTVPNLEGKCSTKSNLGANKKV